MSRTDDEELIPAPPVSHCVIGDEELDGRRLFIVGDIHGCLDEFQALLTQANVTADNTLVICCGDLVSKGPKSCETVAFIRSLGSRAVRSVRGNHDEEALQIYARRSKRGAKSTSTSWTEDLQLEDVEFLQSLPYTISVPAHNVIVVHAGLVPKVPLDSQRPIDMTTMKDVQKKGDGYVGAGYDADGPWAHAWTGPEHVYFGHNAARGLQANWNKHPFATGLDTGCVKGLQLTGAVVKLANEKPVLISVPASQVYKPVIAKKK